MIELLNLQFGRDEEEGSTGLGVNGEWLNLILWSGDMRFNWIDTCAPSFIEAKLWVVNLASGTFWRKKDGRPILIGCPPFCSEK